MALETTSAKHQAVSHLPVTVTSPVDVGRLIRELDMIDDRLLQLSLRRIPGTEVSLPKTSQLLEQTTQLNHLNMLQIKDRQRLKEFLVSIRDHAPLLHISFSADPPTNFIEKLMTWLRREIHPLVLLTVGLQPNIGAGCVVRTVNKQFDCSLRQDFTDKHDLLKAALALPVEVSP